MTSKDESVEKKNQSIIRNLSFIIKMKIYLIIPILCILFWAIISLIKDNFILEAAADFPSFYYAGQNIFTNPEFIYSAGIVPRYRYLPCFAMIFAILSLFNYVTSAWIYFFILLIIAFLAIIEFDKILKLQNVNSKFNRFLILIVISNGLRIMLNFDILQTKFIVLYLILVFIRREIEFKKSKEQTEKNLKFFFIQISILIFVIGLLPYIAFILIIYLFNNINLRRILSKSQLQKYLLVVVAFFIQNFMFIIVPPLFVGFLSGLSRSGYPLNLTPTDIITLRDNLLLPPNTISALIIAFNIAVDFIVLSIFSIVLMFVVTLILTLNKKLSIEEKFAYFFLLNLISNVYFDYEQSFVIFLPLIVILFINLKSYNSISNYIKQNFFNLLGLLGVILLYFMPPIYLFYELIPISINIPLALLIIRHTFAYIIIILAFLMMKLIQKNAIHLKKN
ncbi:MAG: hypothetical protein ACFE9Z_00695 [Promethearchaeota archaeon]